MPFVPDKKETYSAVKTRYEASVSRYGDGILANGHNRLALPLKAKLVRRQLESLPIPEAGLDMLDSGCGNGAFRAAFDRVVKVRRMDGVDLVPESARIAKSRYGYSAARSGNVLDLDTLMPAKSYDLVASCGVFLYIRKEHYARFFKAHARPLRDGGHLLMTMPNLHSLTRGLWAPRTDFPVRFHLAEVLEAMLPHGLLPVSLLGGDLLTRRVFRLPEDFHAAWRFRLSFTLSVLARKGRGS